MPIDWALTRVVKKLTPSSLGARKLGQRYGDALVCVRHRHDPTGTTRYTTVELVVDQAPTSRRNASPVHDLIAVRPDPHNQAVREQLIAMGARWDSQQRVWWLARTTAKHLRVLSDQVALPPAPRQKNG